MLAQKFLIALILVSLLSVISLGSVATHIDKLADLAGEYANTMIWAANDLEKRYLTALSLTKSIVQKAEIELVATIKESSTLYEAKGILGAAYIVVGMRLGIRGLRNRDLATLNNATFLVNYGGAKLKRLTK